MMKPKPDSHIVLPNSRPRRGRKPKPQPADLRAFRIGLIASTWQRVVARQMSNA